MIEIEKLRQPISEFLGFDGSETPVPFITHRAVKAVAIVACEFNEMCYRLLRGDMLMRKVLSDSAQAIPLLCAYELVDSECVGMLGHSYGGNLVVLATDDKASQDAEEIVAKDQEMCASLGAVAHIEHKRYAGAF